MKGEFCGNLLCLMLNYSWKHSKYLMIYQKQSGKKKKIWGGGGGNFANIDRQEAKFVISVLCSFIKMYFAKIFERNTHTHIYVYIF